jgi:prevent-host-death family protein
MDYVTVRELREKSGEVWQRIEAGEEIVVTRRGKPFAILVATQPSQVEDQLRALRTARFAGSLKVLQAQSVAQGLHKMSQAQINAQIAAARKHRRERQARGH